MYNRDDMICSFCVNDYHLAVMLMPYIYEEKNKGKKVVTFFEKDLTSIALKVFNTNENYWTNEEIFKSIDWSKIEFDKIAKKFENVKDDDIIVIAGKDVFIERMNKLLLNFHINFTILNCYNISDIAKNENFKITEYSKLLNTKGLKEIEKLDLV